MLNYGTKSNGITKDLVFHIKWASMLLAVCLFFMATQQVYAQTVTIPELRATGFGAAGTYGVTVPSNNQGQYTSYPYPFTGQLSPFTTQPFFNTYPNDPPAGGVGPLDAGATSRLISQRGPSTNSWTTSRSNRR